jgi:hypothetical protein
MRELKIALVVVLVLLLLCTGAALGILIFQPQLLTPLAPLAPPVEAAEGPAILIDRPSHGDQVFVGQGVEVFATGYDPAKIERMQIWVDGEMVISQASPFRQGMNPFPLLAIWIPETLGNHTIVVRGYDMAGVTGQASLTLSAVEAPEIATELPQEGCAGVVVIEHQVQDGETLEGIAAQHEVTAEQILACNPALEPAAPLAHGDTLLVPYLASPEEEEPLSPDVELPVTQLPPEVEDEPGEELPPPEEEPRPGEDPPEDLQELPEGPADVGPVTDPPRAVLEVEATDLATDQPYSAGYCLVRLGDGDMEWIPGGEDLFLPPEGATWWEIAAELGGVGNSRTVPVYGDTLRLEMHCYAFREQPDAEPIYLGEVIRDHTELDWTADLLEATSDDGEDGSWFRIRYRLCPGTCYPERELPAPYALGMDLIAGNPYLRWQWDGDLSAIDKFVIYRNGVFRGYTGTGANTSRLGESDLYPPCDQTYRFQVSAYNGPLGHGVESPLSGPFQFPPTGAEPCVERRVLLGFGDLHTGCLPADCGQAGGDDCSDCLLNLWYGFITANRELLAHVPPECPNGVCAWTGPILKSYSCSDAPYNIFTPCLWPPASTTELFDDQDVLVVNLGEGEDLNIGILLMDSDRSGRDLLLCEGRKAFPASEMEDWEDNPPPPYLLSCTKGGKLVAYVVVHMLLPV